MPSALSVIVHSAPVLRTLDKLEKRTAYIQGNAVNRTIKRVQTEERSQFQGRHVVRRPDFVLRQVAIIKPFASPAERRFWAKISVGQRPRLLLSQLETGGPRPPAKGRRVAVPLTGGPARPSFRSSVLEAFTFRALRLVRETTSAAKGRLAGPKRQRARRRRADVGFEARETAGGKIQFKGAQRTFILGETARAPEGGVFQRVGPGRDDIRLIYSFKARPLLAASLRFLVTARTVVDRWFGHDLEQEIRAAARHALGGR